MIKNCGKMRYILLTMLMLCVAILGSAMNVNAARLLLQNLSKIKTEMSARPNSRN